MSFHIYEVFSKTSTQQTAFSPRNSRQCALHLKTPCINTPCCVKLMIFLEWYVCGRVEVHLAHSDSHQVLGYGTYSGDPFWPCPLWPLKPERGAKCLKGILTTVESSFCSLILSLSPYVFKGWWVFLTVIYSVQSLVSCFSVLDPHIPSFFFFFQFPALEIHAVSLHFSFICISLLWGKTMRVC